MDSTPPVLVEVLLGETTSSLAGRIGVSNLELLQANRHKRVLDEMYFFELFEGEMVIVPERVAHQFLDQTGAIPMAKRPLGASDPTRPIQEMAPAKSPCGAGWKEIAPGVCVPDSIPSAGNQGPCPEGQYYVSPAGICVPKPSAGGPPDGGTPSKGCGPGFRELLGGVCIPESVPIGSSRGSCPEGQIEAVPGVCIPGGGLPGSNLPTGNLPGPEAHSVQECIDAYGANYAPYRDPKLGIWGCAACEMEHEILAANGFCYCGDGYVRQDPSDPNSPCVPASSVPTDRPTGASSLKEAMDYCRNEYGPNSGAVLVDGEYRCNVCGANEQFSEVDGYCHCLAGTERAVPGDGSSACVPVKEKSSTPSWVAPVAAGVITATFLGVLFMGSSDGKAKEPTDTTSPRLDRFTEALAQSSW